MFLQLRPIRAFASHPATDEKTATVTLGLEAETRVVATDEQPNCTFPAQLEIVPPIDQGRFDITAPIDLPFKDINTLLNQQLYGRVFPDKVDALGQVTLERVQVVASGNRVLIELAVKTREEITWFGLGARATIYVWARPRLDIVAQKLRFTDLTVDVRSNAGWGLFGAAARLAIPYLKDELEKDLVIDLEPYVTSARAGITGAIITFNKPETGINANATVTDFRLTDIEFDSNIVRFVAEGTGTAKIEIIKLPDLPAAADQTGSATIMPPGSPSFNCSLATSPDEIAICRSAALANLDRHLGALFQGRLANLRSREQVGYLKEEQRNWLQQRAACRSDENCLLEKYNSRMKQLTEGQDRRTATSQPILPTFDCSVAANSDEIAVCRNPALASLDQQLATSFQKLLVTLAPSEQRRLKEEQRSWLQKRSTCSSNESCLLAAYASRISQLGSVP